MHGTEGPIRLLIPKSSSARGISALAVRVLDDPGLVAGRDDRDGGGSSGQSSGNDSDGKVHFGMLEVF